MSLTETPTLRKRIIHASMWTFGGHFVSQGIRLLSNLILTRMLAPEMFGVMALVVLVMMGVTLLTDIGLQTNVVQSRESHNTDFLNSIWTIQILKGLFIWLLMIIAGIGLYLLVKLGFVPTSAAYANPILPLLIPILGFSLVISAFEPTWIMLATKEFKQHLIIQIDIISQIISVVVMISWAILDKSVWALVVGSLSYSISRLLISVFCNKNNLNKWHWDPEIAHRIIHFGKWIFISTIFGYIVNNGDRLMLGGMVNEKLMGLHSIAYFFIMAIMGVYGKFLSNVVYPALCEINHNSTLERLESTFYKFRYISDAALFTSAGALWICSESIINFLYDARYHQTGEILKIMSIGLLGMRYNVSDQLFLSVGKPELMTVGILVKMIALLVLFPIGFYYYGFNGALWAAVIASFSAVPIVLINQFKLKVFSIKKELITIPLLIFGGTFGFVINNILR